MALPNDSFQRTPDGSGALIATHLVGTKEYPVVMEAGPAGHIFGTRDSFLVIGPATGGSAVGTNKVHFDLWNGSSSTMDVHGIWCMNDMDVGVTGVVAVRIDLFRTSAEGTTGTALTFDTASTATRTIIPIVPGTSLPAGITAREAPGGGATSSLFIGEWYIMPEEGATSQGYYTQFQNGLRYAGLEDMSDLVVPAGTGIKIVQGPVASVGRVGYRVAFTTY
jgi:hypothetical protein